MGTSTARSIATQSWGIQQEGTNYSNTGISLTANRNDADSAYLVFAKTRGTSVGSVTSVNSQDNLGGIFFAGADGSTVNSYGAAITAFTDGTPGTNDMPGRLVFSTTADGAASPTERLRITSAGRVGIGTTSPSQLLHCERTTAGVTALFGVNDGTFNPRLAVYGGSTGTTIQNTWSSSASNLIFANGGAVGSGTEAMRIDSSGRLLVGTSTSVSTSDTFTPSVQVAGTGTLAAMSVQRYAANTSCPYIILQKSRSGTIGSQAIVNSGDILGAVAFEGSDGSAFQKGAEISAQVDGTPGAGDMPGRLVFSTTADGASSPTERMRINNQGHIGFGTNVDINNLPGGGTNNATGVAVASNIFKACSSNYTMQVGVSSTGAGYALMQIFQNGTQCGGITVSNSNATAFVTSSDYRLKENIAPIQNAGSRLLLLRPSSFNFQNNPGVVIDGFIAHEVQAVVPEAIHGTKDEVDDDGNPVYQGIDQSKLVPLLTAALQEAIVKIETLEARLTAAGIE